MAAPQPRTRLIITAIPPTLTTAQLTAHLARCPSSSSANPQLTDCKILSKRRIAFLGFKSAAEAERILKWLDGSFITSGSGGQGSRVNVDWAIQKDAPSPHKRSRVVAPPSSNLSTISSTTSTFPSSSTASTPAATTSIEEQARFAEFMAVMRPAGRTTLSSLKAAEQSLANGETAMGVSRFSVVQPLTAAELREKAKDAGGGAGEEEQVIGFAGRSIGQDQAASAAIELQKQQDDAARTAQVKVVDDGVANDEEISDADYMARRMKRKLDFDEYDPSAVIDEEEGEEEDIEAMDAEEERERMKREGAVVPKKKQDDEPVLVVRAWEKAELDPGELSGPASSSTSPAVASGSGAGGAMGSGIDATYDQAIALITESSRLFVRNLGFFVEESELRELFGEFGEISAIQIPLDPATRSSKGLAYITYASASSAINAFDSLDRTSFQGRLIHILPAIIRNARPNDEGSKGSGVLSVKEGRWSEKKKDEGGLSWGTLFMNSDAVISSIADRLNVDKAEILDPMADNAAVRVALAETHVIAETKKYFESEGISLSSFTTTSSRSFATLLLKNIPYPTSRSTLLDLFAPYGTPLRLLLPPAGTIAMVQMSSEEEGRSAFRGLSYMKLGAGVLYLEKAPRDIWNGARAAIAADASGEEAAIAGPSASNPNTSIASAVATTSASMADGAEDEPGSTLFIKNLSFSTTTTSLTSAFLRLGFFSFARVQQKPDPKVAGGLLSMGFGFVGFRNVEAARKAMALRQGFELEGHRLEIRFAARGREEENAAAAASKKSSKIGQKSEKMGKGSKIIVKNVPFEVTRKEIRELFSAYGQLKSVRMPLKQDHRTRGFAFLEFTSNTEAIAAFTALEHTHLLGRHLVLQWAEDVGLTGESMEEEGVEGLRKRTASSFSKRKIGNKKERFEMTGKGEGTDDGTMG